MPTTTRGLRYPASSAQPNVNQDIQNLASDVNGALVQNWVDAVVSQTSYDAPAGALADLPGYNISVTVPSGRTMDVEYKAPRVEVTAVGGMTLLLKINGVVLDSVDIICGVNTTQGAWPARLTGSFIGTGSSVIVQVQAVISGAGGRVRGSAYNGPRLRYRFI